MAVKRSALIEALDTVHGKVISCLAPEFANMLNRESMKALAERISDPHVDYLLRRIPEIISDVEREEARKAEIEAWKLKQPPGFVAKFGLSLLPEPVYPEPVYPEPVYPEPRQSATLIVNSSESRPAERLRDPSLPRAAVVSKARPKRQSNTRKH